jgi:hypothetical protein
MTGPSDPIMGQSRCGFDPGQKQDPATLMRADADDTPAPLVPGLRPVSVKGIQAALRAARTLP